VKLGAPSRHEEDDDDDCIDDRSALHISHNGQKLEEYCDGGEPEDNTFTRDWSWVPKELRRAYALEAPRWQSSGRNP